VDVVVERTHPPLEVLHQFDPRVWRSLSPTWTIPPFLTPLSPSSKGTQTRQPTRGIQHLPIYKDKATNTEVTARESFTPPGSPPSYTPPGSPPIIGQDQDLESLRRRGFKFLEEAKQPFSGLTKLSSITLSEYLKRIIICTYLIE